MPERVVVSGGGGVEYRLGTLMELWLVLRQSVSSVH